MKTIEHVEMSGMNGWFMLQPGGEILNKPSDGLQPTQPYQTNQPIPEHVNKDACQLVELHDNVKCERGFIDWTSVFFK